MKYILILSMLICFGFSCSDDKPIPYLQIPLYLSELPPLPPSPNYDSMCIVGKKYTLYPFFYDKKNPYSEQPKKVIITAKRSDGFETLVQYCLTKQYKKKGVKYFHLSAGAFISQTVNTSK